MKVIFLGVLLSICGVAFGAPLSQLVKANATLFQDDVKDDPNDRLIGTRNFWRDRRFRWPRGVIPFEISNLYTNAEQTLIRNSIRHWEERTCIRFMQRTASDRDFVEMTPDDGTDSYCYSWVGRQGGRQIMKMFGECMRNGAMLHELGHVIGFNHEHQRPDRDDFIVVHLQNVVPEFRFAFNRFTTIQVDTMGTRYDFASVMHYPFFAFTPFYDVSRPAMTLRNGSIDPIRREAEFLSVEDIRKTQLYYENCSVV